MYKRILHEGKYHYGLHLMAHVENCSDAITDKNKVTEFLIDICNKIDMVRFGDPLVERFGDGIEEGISAVQLIETSAVVMHTNDGARELYLDVFSCKDYSIDVAKQCVLDHFKCDDTIISYKAFYRE